jgi:hypothetical protein
LARHPISASIEIKIETTWGSREERFNSHLKTPSSYPLDAKANLLQRRRLLPVQKCQDANAQKTGETDGEKSSDERERDKDPEKKHHPAHTRTRYKRRHRGRRRRKALSLSFTTYIIG